MVITDTFHEFSIILLLGAFGGFLGQFFKQPLIVSLIAVGILVGPSGLDILSSNINVLSQIGISVLLFVVGLKLDVSEMKNLDVSLCSRGWDRFCLHHLLVLDSKINGV